MENFSSEIHNFGVRRASLIVDGCRIAPAYPAERGLMIALVTFDEISKHAADVGIRTTFFVLTELCPEPYVLNHNRLCIV